MKTSNYQNLDCWKKSIELTKQIYLLVRLFPKEETFALSDQMRRSAVSIASNIAEGHGRNSNKEFIRFLSYARGSICELQTQLIISAEVGLVQREYVDTLFAQSIEIDKMISALSKYLESRE